MISSDIFISTSNFKSKHYNNLDLILDNIDDRVKCIEIASGHITTVDTIDKIKSMVNEGKRVLLHNYPIDNNNLMVNLCTTDNEYRKQIISYIKEMMKLTKELNENYFSFHGGFFQLDKSLSTQKDIFIDSMKYIIDYAELLNMSVGIENHVVTKENVGKLFLCDISDYNLIFSSITSNKLKLHLDLGHLKVTSNTYDFSVDSFIEEFSRKIEGVHIHENNGIIDSHSYIDDDSNLVDKLTKLDKLKYIVLETWDQEYSNVEKAIRRINDVL